MFCFRRIYNSVPLKRFYSNKLPIKNLLEHLKQRSLIKVTGPDAAGFLQGLITNDIYHLSQKSGGSMYTMFLNTKGRVLYDSIIYKTEEENSYFLECDKEASQKLQKHLKMYKVKRKIDIHDLVEEYKIYSLFDVNSYSLDSTLTDKKPLEGAIVPCDQLNSTLPESSTTTKIYKNLTIFKDPRVAELGSRIITRVDVDVCKELCDLKSLAESGNRELYKEFRYSLGISEGLKDLPSGNCFPLECNCDYLHGVSFHKGCYIGQELTARTHHTGIVRKRLMPLLFSKVPRELPSDNVILHKNVNLGKLRGIEGNLGLALLRIEKALDFGEISVGDGIANVLKPHWWPLEAPKERMNVEKNLKL